MIALIQKVHSCELTVNNNLINKINDGLVVTVGVFRDDEKFDAERLARKISTLRVFKDEFDKINKSVLDVDGEILVVSNFTLCGEIKSGTRPNFSHAKEPEEANYLYEYIAECLKNNGVKVVKLGSFKQHMHLNTLIDGPFNIILNSKTF